ncbi:MAG TPA: double zinc ribbon domain-containing protein [Gaiellaceae bacterium]|nr:double zinc ribbon domain-containing protein [Gaiellaceae bacterium]
MLDLLLPRRCVVCAAGGTFLCDGCRRALPFLTPPLCALCGAPTAWPVARCRECSGRRLGFVHASAAVAYDADVRRLVRSWKERGLRSLADAAALAVVERLPRPDADAVTFVPADRGRRRRRGYHPAEQLARGLSDRWGLPCVPLLSRSGGTRQQGLSRGDRRRNVAHAFAVRATAPPRVVLVDDVYTTGETAHAAASALRTRVEVVTFARAVRT